MILDIVITIIFPIFFLIGIGALANRLFNLDIATLSKLNFYVFVPALVFIKVLESNFSPYLFRTVVVFYIVLLCLLFICSWLIFSQRSMREHRPTLTMGALFFNAGNYGLPLALLAFGEVGLNVMVVILLVQNLLSFTFGIVLITRGGENGQVLDLGQLVKTVLQTPVVIAILLGLLLRSLSITLPQPLYDPLKLLSAGLIPIALLTLGAQLAIVRFDKNSLALATVTGIRLLLSPILAIIVLYLGQLLFGVDMTPMAPVLIVAAGLPVAVNVFILATEYNRDPELASQSVFITTLLSAITITFWIGITRMI